MQQEFTCIVLCLFCMIIVCQMNYKFFVTLIHLWIIYHLLCREAPKLTINSVATGRYAISEKCAKWYLFISNEIFRWSLYCIMDHYMYIILSFRYWINITMLNEGYWTLIFIYYRSKYLVKLFSNHWPQNDCMLILIVKYSNIILLKIYSKHF